ncbi:hypothetical protein [Streptomyces sp. NPDC059513]|uniref:hypothetical protein n=1 Tax=unclassified Streptomyces TaxID=2593676 RepID=UPI003695EA59
MALVPTEPVNRTILLVDIESYTRRDNVEQTYLRRGLYDVADEVLLGAGVRPSQQYREDRGDGIVILLSGDVSKTALLKTLVRTVPDLLSGYNRLASQRTQMRLRIVLASGEVALHPRNGSVGGLVGHDLNQACRLLDAPVLREALRQRQAEHVLCVSRSVYDGVVRHHYPGLPPEHFHAVTAPVKEDVLDGWLHGPVPNASPRTDEVPEPFAASGPAVPVAGPQLERRSSVDGSTGTPPRPVAAEGRSAGAQRLLTGRRSVLAGLVVATLGSGAVIGASVTWQALHDSAESKPAYRPSAAESSRPHDSPPPGQFAESSSRPLVTPSDASIFYQDEFTDHSRWTDDGHYQGASYARASYLVYSPAAGVRRYVIGYPKYVTQLYPTAPRDLSIEVWARHDRDSDNGYGVACHARPDTSGYFFSVWGGDAYIEKKAPGTQRWVKLRTVRDSSAIRPTGQNHFEVSCVTSPDGRSVELGFSLNSTELATVTDRDGPLLAEGTVAVVAGSDESVKSPETVEFSHLKLKHGQ